MKYYSLKTFFFIIQQLLLMKGDKYYINLISIISQIYTSLQNYNIYLTDNNKFSFKSILNPITKISSVCS